MVPTVDISDNKVQEEEEDGALSGPIGKNHPNNLSRWCDLW